MAGGGQADTSLYSFSIAGLDEGVFAVLRFEAVEKISGPSSIRLLAISPERGLEHDDLVGKEGILKIHVNGEHQLHGVVCEFHEEPFGDALSRYEILLRGRLALLELAAHCRVFQGKSSKEIVEEVLKGAGMDAKSFKSSLKGSYGPLDMHVQYNESDFAFLSRTVERDGIFYFEQVDGDDVVLVLGDDNSVFPTCAQDKPMQYRPGSGLVETAFDALYSLRRSNSIHRGKFSLSGYDYEKPGAVQSGSASGSGHGDWTRHEVAVMSGADATSDSKRMLESDKMVRDRVTGTTHNPMMRSGTKFQISQEHGYGFGGDYLLVEVRHEGSQEGSMLGNGVDSHYKNEIVAQPIALPFRPAMKTPRPHVSGVIVAKSDGPDGPYAHLDEAGRYRARLPFDQSSAGPGQATPPIRLAQPYAGPGYGLHLPIHKGVDLVLAFEDGDIDKPIAVGAVPNPANKSPVANANRSQSTLKSASGNIVVLDDLEGKTRIEMISSGKHKALFDDTPDTSGILVETTRKNRLKLDDKNMSLELSTCDKKHSLTILDEKGIATLTTKSGHVLQLNDEKKFVQLQTSKGHVLKLDDDGDLITLADSKGKHTIQIDASGKISIKTDGDFELEAKGAIKMKGKDVSIEATGKMDVKATQDLKMSAMNINAKAQQKVAIEATMDAGLKGLNVKLEGQVNVESKAGVANKMTGTMTNVESSAINTIKGAMVMIN
jgi:type VI secretion system secreted protein VgrG